MSYFIEYDKKVIRTTRGYIFMTLGGDNNLTTSKWAGPKRKWIEVAVRSWNGPIERILEASETEIMDYCHDVYDQYPDYEAFKCRGKWIYHKDMERYFKNGMTHAQPLEDLIRANPGQFLSGYVCVYPSRDSFTSEKYLKRDMVTTPDLEQWLDEAKLLREKYLSDGKSCHIYLSFCGEEPLVYARKHKDCQIVVKSNCSGYLCKYECGRSLQFSANLSDAIIFDSEDAARDAIGKYWKHIKFVSYEGQLRAATTEKPYTLLFGAGKLAGYYLESVSRSKIYGTYQMTNAKAFRSEAEALRYVKNLRSRGFSETRFGKFTLLNTKNNDSTELSA